MLLGFPTKAVGAIMPSMAELVRPAAAGVLSDPLPAMNLQLESQLAFVTASSGGIGLKIATTLAREGATVIVNGRSASSVDSAVAEIRKVVPDARLESLAADNGTAEGV